MSLGASYWQRRFSRWPRPGGGYGTADGYTLLMPVPGDLPVFLDLALAVCRLQDHAHRRRTLVIPDVRTPLVEAAVERARPQWPGELAIIDLPRPERWLLPKLRDPGRNHAVQLIAGVRASPSSHIILHDADLFLLRPDGHERIYGNAVAGKYAVTGVNSSWDPWYAAHDLTLAATWEMCARVDWLRSFPPFRHIAHDDVLFGELHTFDTTFWAQCRTEKSQIGILDFGADIVHFNYVISTYRHYQRSGPGFHDDAFRLLFIRLLIDLFDKSGMAYAVPSMAELVAGLGDPAAPVWYSRDDAANYRTFRGKLDAIVQGPWVEDARRGDAVAAIAAFDAHFDQEVPA
jgi:hypothetical protein